jgi:hypothetical protein
MLHAAYAYCHAVPCLWDGQHVQGHWCQASEVQGHWCQASEVQGVALCSEVQGHWCQASEVQGVALCSEVQGVALCSEVQGVALCSEVQGVALCSEVQGVALGSAAHRPSGACFKLAVAALPMQARASSTRHSAGSHATTSPHRTLHMHQALPSASAM